jgi:hypothetical protein
MNKQSVSSTMPESAEGKLNRASSSAHAAVDSIAGVAEEAARKAKPAIDRAASMAHQAVDKAADAAAPTADWLDERGERLKAAKGRLVADTCVSFFESGAGAGISAPVLVRQRLDEAVHPALADDFGERLAVGGD